MDFENVMVDLETLGTVPGCVILSIGAVMFNPYRRQIGETFYRVVNIQSCLDSGLIISTDTLQWWWKQSPEAQKVLNEAESEESINLSVALFELGNFLRGCGPEVKVWGNGADFDNAILQVAYQKTGAKQPWKFFNNRCYRTIKAIKDSKITKRTGTHHNALDDAVSQAEHLIEICQQYPNLIQ